MMSLEQTMFKFVQKADFKNPSPVRTSQSRRLLWLLPFFAFFIGYVIAGFLLHKTDFATPNVIGKQLHESVQILSKHHLGIRLLQQREDATLPEGTILDQLPRPDQKVRSNQHVFVIVSTKQQPIVISDFWGKKMEDVLASVAKKELDSVIVHVPSPYPAKLCIAQLPSGGQGLEGKKITLYFSSGKESASIMPNLIGSQLCLVQEALSKYDIRAEIFHTRAVSPDHTCSACTIIDQQPKPGSIIDLERGLDFQFKVS